MERGGVGETRQGPPIRKVIYNTTQKQKGRHHTKRQVGQADIRRVTDRIDTNRQDQGVKGKGKGARKGSKQRLKGRGRMQMLLYIY